jgi:hypothetical protein
MLALRWALDDRVEVGRPLLEDLNHAVAALALEDLADIRAAASKIVAGVGETWPRLKDSQRKRDVVRIVEKARFDLVVARANELGGEPGIRFLIEEGLAGDVIVGAMNVSDEEFARVNALVEAERAERARVLALLREVADKSEEERIKHLIGNDVADELIVELAGVERGTVDAARKAMEAELAEKKRLAEEEAERKRKEAEGPPLDEIPSDQMLEYIESIREILEFSEVENEIRAMCEQSSIPKSLVDVAVSDAGRLDELESKAEAG